MKHSAKHSETLSVAIAVKTSIEKRWFVQFIIAIRQIKASSSAAVFKPRFSYLQLIMVRRAGVEAYCVATRTAC